MNADKLTEILRLSEQNTKLIEALQSEAEENNEYIKQLESQLSASQARERAAVEDMKRIARKSPRSNCEFCNQKGCIGCYSEHNFEWRGPKAGKGEAE